MSPLTVTFVCTGNLCRSPMAGIMFAQQIRERGLSDMVRVNSAGTNAWRRGGADPRACRVLRANGYPAEHTITPLNGTHLNSDLLVVAARRHLLRLMDYGVPAERIALLRAFDAAWAGRSDVPDLADPYYSGDFARTFADIDAALPGLHRWVDNALEQVSPAYAGLTLAGLHAWGIPSPGWACAALPTPPARARFGRIGAPGRT